MTRSVLIAALVVYAAVTLGCMLSTSGQANDANRTDDHSHVHHLSTVAAQGLPMRGFAMQLQRVDFFDKGGEYERAIDEIVDWGGDSVFFVVDSHMENGGSSAIYLDVRTTPTPPQLGALIDYAKGKKLRVILMPIVLLDRPRNEEWRGKIAPEGKDNQGRENGWDNWWESYRAMMYHYSWISEAHHVDILVVGSELVSTETQTREWAKTIDAVRAVYHGMLTYSANWDHYTEVPFWDRLDLIGVNAYYTLGKDHNVTVEQIEQNWATPKKNLLSFRRQMDKPLLFLEVGWCSQQNAAHDPWDYTQDQIPIDLDLQKRLYDAFFQTWYGNPEFGGYMLWEWSSNGGPQNRGYTPKGKPAEAVVREWFAKPKWKVQ